MKQSWKKNKNFPQHLKKIINCYVTWNDMNREEPCIKVMFHVWA